MKEGCEFRGPNIVYVDLDDEERKARLKGGVRKEVELWASDHFGIAVGIKVR